MTARILDKDSHFKAGDTAFLPKGPLLKRLTWQHCSKLMVGERIWLAGGKEDGSFTAATVTKVVTEDTGIQIHYNYGNGSGFSSIHRKQSINYYRFLDEDALIPITEKAAPQLKVVGED
jgi:hypothetical protein